jgi:hypothetical protein
VRPFAGSKLVRSFHEPKPVWRASRLGAVWHNPFQRDRDFVKEFLSRGKVREEVQVREEVEVVRDEVEEAFGQQTVHLRQVAARKLQIDFVKNKISSSEARSRRIQIIKEKRSWRK